MCCIISLPNSKSKYIRSLLQKKFRQKYGEYTIEGIKSVKDAVASDKRIKMICVSESFLMRQEFDYPHDIPIYKAPDDLFMKLSDTKTPQGILAVLETDKSKRFKPDLNEAYIYCDGINDPGNLGTIIRTADAAGFGGVLLSEKCADLYSPKTVRSSMGSFFNVNVIPNITLEDISNIKSGGFNLIGGALGDNTVDYRTADFTRPVIIVVGNEANGISDEVMRLCECVKIPIIGKAESLNVGVAAAILMYEVVRQRS